MIQLPIFGNKRIGNNSYKWFDGDLSINDIQVVLNKMV